MRSQTLTLASGLALATPALAQPDWALKEYPLPEAQYDAKSLQVTPIRKAGVLYLNMSTGERTLTRYLDAKTALPEIHHDAAALFDVWLALDQNPCWDDPRADGFGWTADATDDTTLELPITEPVIGFDFGDMPFDSVISGLILNATTLATESTDSNADGTPDTGIDTVAAFYDAISERNRTSVSPPTAIVRVESIPGLAPGTDPSDPSQLPLDYDIILDFGGTHFELGDSDALNRGDLWLPGANPGLDLSLTMTTTGGAIVPNPTPDGLADFQYLQHFTQHGSNLKVTDDSTFIGLGMAEGLIIFESYTTVTSYSTSDTFSTGTFTVTLFETILIPDGPPQAQSAFEGFGIGALGPGADYNNLDWGISTYGAGCCYWFGGLDCYGFLDQLQPDPEYNGSWYNFTPFAQNAMGLLSSDAPPETCTTIDFSPDGLLDNADIGGFIAAFIAGDPAADLNGDAVADNGDISAFVQIFVSCTG